MLGNLSLVSRERFCFASYKNLAVKALNLDKDKRDHCKEALEELVKPRDTKNLKELKGKAVVAEVELLVRRSLRRPEGDNPGGGREACGDGMIFSCRMVFHV